MEIFLKVSDIQTIFVKGSSQYEWLDSVITACQLEQPLTFKVLLLSKKRLLRFFRLSRNPREKLRPFFLHHSSETICEKSWLWREFVPTCCWHLYSVILKQGYVQSWREWCSLRWLGFLFLLEKIRNKCLLYIMSIFKIDMFRKSLQFMKICVHLEW